MGDFILAQQHVLRNEGGYAPIDADTYRGIARRFFPQWNGWEIVDKHKPLAQGQIIKDPFLEKLIDSFYKRQFWDNIHGDQILLQPIASYVYDWHVNAGRNAIKSVQRVLGITDDGIFGNDTLKALNDAGDILKQLRDKRIAYYIEIGHGDNAKYLAGWENRANVLYEKLV